MPKKSLEVKLKEAKSRTRAWFNGIQNIEWPAESCLGSSEGKTIVDFQGEISPIELKVLQNRYSHLTFKNEKNHRKAIFYRF